MCDCYNLITETQVTHKETNAFSATLFGTPGTPCSTTYNGSEAACALYNCPSSRTYASSVQTILQSAIVAGGGIPACHTFSPMPPSNTRKSRGQKNAEYCFLLSQATKARSWQAKRSIFFYENIQCVIMVVTFCGYPRFMCAQRQNHAAVPTIICLNREKKG